MFTTGRIIFVIVFFILFIIGIAWAYRKDLQQIRKWKLRPSTVFLSLILILFIYYVFSRVI